MGLDQYVYVNWIPRKFFEESKNYGETLELVVHGFYEYDKCNKDKTTYFRKGYPIDRLLMEMSTWNDEDNYYFFIPSENVQKIYDECIRVIQSIPEFNHLAVPQFFSEYPTSYAYINKIESLYPVDSERESDLYTKMADVGLDNGYSDPSWDLLDYYDLLKLIHTFYEKDSKDFNLFYVRSY